MISDKADAEVIRVIAKMIDMEGYKDSAQSLYDIASRLAAASSLSLQDGQPRPSSEYHKNMGPVLWWKFPVNEPPYCGTPNDLGFSVEIATATQKQLVWVGGWPGYHTHFTRIDAPPAPAIVAEERRDV
jgi:hypothetical protein